jgi:hypothetical protein
VTVIETVNGCGGAPLIEDEVEPKALIAVRVTV